MSDDALSFVVMGVAVALILAVFGNVVGANNTDWVKTEDPACYLRIHEDKRLIGPDSTTRVRYCEVPS
jgi:hypothetical protein